MRVEVTLIAEYGATRCAAHSPAAIRNCDDAKAVHHMYVRLDAALALERPAQSLIQALRPRKAERCTRRGCLCSFLDSSASACEERPRAPGLVGCMKRAINACICGGGSTLGAHRSQCGQGSMLCATGMDDAAAACCLRSAGHSHSHGGHCISVTCAALSSSELLCELRLRRWLSRMRE